MPVKFEECSNCHFWRMPWKLRQRALSQGSELSGLSDKRGPDGRVRSHEKGLCCRYAPHISALTTVWMETRASDWCGEYEARAEIGDTAAEALVPAERRPPASPLPPQVTGRAGDS